MKSRFFYTLSSVALSVAIFALAAPATAQGRRPGGHGPGGGSNSPRPSMQQSPSGNRSDRSTTASQPRPSSSDRSTAAPQSRPSSSDRSAAASQPRPSSSDRSTAAPQSRPSNNRPNYSAPGGDNNRPRGGGNHGGGNNGGGRNNGDNNGGNNKGYQNQRPNASIGHPEDRNFNNNSRIYQPGQQKGGGNVNPGNGNDRPGGGNDRPGGGNNRPGGGNDRPGGNVNPGNGNHPGGGNHGGGNNGGNYRPGDNGNHRPGGGHGGNNGGNYRPGDNGNNRPGGGHGGPGNGRPGGSGFDRPGGPHHGGINHGGPRPDYDRYRWHSSVRPRGPRDRWYDYYRYNRWSWRAPIAPPYRQWRPRIVWYYRPVIPTGYRFYASAPIISGVLGLEFGTYLDASLNYLYYNGYDIDGYQDNVVYLRDVNMMGYSWPDVMLQYDTNGGMCYAEFVTSASYQDDYRFRSIYNSLCNTFGTPINSGNGYYSWYGRDGNGYVNLNTVYDNGRYFTVLTFGA